MFRTCLLLLTLFASLFASTSAFAASEQTKLSLPLANTIQQCCGENVTHIENLNVFQIPPETSNKPLIPISQRLSKSIDFAYPNRLNLLNHQQQQPPEYIQVYELLTEQLDVFADRESILAQSPIPWFMHYSESSSRLSGWKETNSLYASKVTYHLI